VPPDQIYQPVSDEDTESPTPPASELSIVDPAEFRRKSDDERDGLTVEEGASQRQRQPDPESPESAYERPITRHKVAGTGPISVTEATDALRYSRGYKMGEELRAAGFSQNQVEEMATDAIERAQRIEPLAPPPPEVVVLNQFGDEEGEPLTVTEAANKLTEWRAQQQQAQQAELQELVGEAEQERAEVQLAQQAQQAPTEQSQQQPQQPDPVQTERQLVAAERQWIENVKRMEIHELALRNDLDQLVQAVVAEFPSLQHGPPSPEQIEDLRQKDFARFQKLALADKMLRERQQKIAAIAHQRGVHEREKAHLNAVSRAAARAKEDKAFEQLATQHIPNWESVRGEVTAQARKTLQNAGLSDSDIQRLWTGDEAVDAHSSVLQLILAKAALYDRAQERAHQIRQSNLPQVIRPGTYRSASDGDAQSVGELTARLKKATGREAIRLGTALTKARRALNGG